MPKISIILPTYNVEKYIARALDSCINQTLKDIEIIVVDDKGQDKSIDIAYEYAKKDDRIKIINNIENKGAFKSRNVGIKNASSELIMFLDPDDELELNACELAFSKIMGNKNIDVVIFNIQEVTKEKTIKKWNFDCDETILNQSEYKKNYEKYGWSMCNRIFKTEHCLKNLQFMKDIKINGHMAEDFLFNYFITQFYKFVYIMDKYIYIYHSNENSVTKNTSLSQIKININTYNKALKILKNHNIDEVFNAYCIDILQVEKIICCTNILKKIRFSNLEAFLLYAKYKVLKTIVKLQKRV